LILFLFVSLVGVVSASQDSAMNNTISTTTGGDDISLTLQDETTVDKLQASNDDKLSATHDVSGSTVQDIKNLFDSGAVQEGDTIYLGNKDFTSGWSQWGGPVIDVNVGNIVISGGTSDNPDGFSTINANEARVFSFNAPGITLNNVKILNSQGGNGPASAINIDASDCTINNCVFENCQVNQGGAIHGSASASNTQITNCNFTNNEGRWGGSGGAIYFAGSDNKIDGCNFEQNTAGSYGAVYSAGNLAITNSNFNQNIASGSAAVYSGGTLTVRNSNFTSNGRAIEAHSDAELTDCKVENHESSNAAVTVLGTATVRNSNFTSNKASNGNGGALDVTGANSVVDNCNFIGNEVTQAYLYGGAVQLGGSGSTISNSNFEQNSAGHGGALNIEASGVTIDNCNFTDNSAATGGAISVYHDDATISNCNFNENSATSQGGAIYIADDCHNAQMTDSNFTDNNAATGKAIFADGSGDGKVTNCELGGVTDLTVTGGYPKLTFTLATDYSNIVVGNIEGASGEDGSKVPLANEEIQLEIRDSNGDLVDTVTDVTDSNGQITYDYSDLPKDTYTYTATYLDGKTKEGTFGIIQVDGNGFSDIQRAIDNAQAGDIIFLKDITYLNDIDGTMVIDKTLSIIGTDGTVLDAEGESRIFTINDGVSNVVLDHMNFINGNVADGDGGAIYVGANAHNFNVLNSNFTNNHADSEGADGGAIYVAGGSNNGVISNVTFINNTADIGGGAVKIQNGYEWNVYNSTFTNNTAYGNGEDAGRGIENGGGAIWSCYGEVGIHNSTFTANKGTYGGALRGPFNTEDSEFYDNVATNGNGGAIDVTIDVYYVQPPVLSYVNTTFVNNTARGDRGDERAQGGGVHMYNIEHVEILECEFYNNTADRGGAIDLYIINTVNVDNSIIKNNTATSEGGGLYINTTDTPSTFTNSNISDNSAGTEGGAICLVANGALFENVTSVNNTAAKGGSAYIEGNNTLVQNCTFSNNKAIVTDQENSGVGGAIDIVGNDCHLFNVTSDNNTAYRGGSTFIRGNNTLVMDSEFDNNNATLRGGGLNIAGSGCQIINVDVSNNNAFDSDEDESGLGGGLYIVADGTLLRNVTADNNAAKNGGGAYIKGNDVIVDNCTLSNNRAIYNESQTNTSGLGGALDILGNGCNVTNVNSFNNSAHRGGSTFIRGNNTRVEDCKLDGNNATLRGGGLNIAECENCTVTNVEINNNHAGLMGGGIYVVSDGAQFTNITADNNNAERGGGAFINGTGVLVQDSEFNNNKANFNESNPNSTGLGGALDIAGNDCHIINTHSNNNTAYRGGSTFIRGDNTLIENCNLDNNSATLRGGGLNIAGDNCTVNNVSVSNNKAGTMGGGLYIMSNGTTINGIIADNNTAQRGGSTFINGTNVIVKNGELNNNKAIYNGTDNTGLGGGFDIVGDNILVDNVHSNNNTAYRGGSTFIRGSNVTVQNCNLDNNTAEIRGGALNIGGGDNCKIINVSVSNNRASEKGGAVYVVGDNAFFDNVTSIHNHAERGGSSFIEGNNVTVINSDLNNNTASVRGGGLNVAGDGCTFVNVTLSNCNATEEGGAIYVRGNDNEFDNVTSVNNHAHSGGSTYITGNNTIVKDCTLVDNSAISSGGAIAIEGNNNNFTGNNISKNTAYMGGAISIDGENNLFTYNNITFNEAHNNDEYPLYSSGGAMAIQGENTNFTHNNISCNFADETGGAMVCYGDNLYMEDIFAFNNSAENGGFAQIMWANDLIIKNSTFLSNQATGNIDRDRGEGGAIHVSNSENIDIQGYFSYNTATNGSAIYVQDSTLKVHDSTFFDNQAKSYLLIIDYDRWNSTANCTVKGVCNCTCNCSSHNVVNRENTMNNVHNRMLDKMRANGMIDLIRASNYDVCECECGCEGHCADDGSCDCSCEDYKYIATVYEGENITIIVYHKGGDNIANAMYNRDSDVLVNNISYPFYDKDGNEVIKQTPSEDINPVIGPENSHDGEDIYQYPFENNQIITIIVYNESGNVVKNVTYDEINKTDIYGATKLLLTNLTVGNYTVHAIYRESTYYTAIENKSSFRAIPIEDELVQKITVNETVLVGDNVDFVVIVNNTNNFTLHNVTITEIFNTAELQYVNHTNSRLWIINSTYYINKTVDGKKVNYTCIVFKYQGDLAGNSSANFTITFNTLTTGTLVNTVNLTTNETGNKTMSASNKTKVLKLLDKITVNETVFVGDNVDFIVVVTNHGIANGTNSSTNKTIYLTLHNVTITEIFNTAELKYLNHTNNDKWVINNTYYITKTVGDVAVNYTCMVFKYQGSLDVNESANFTITFKTLKTGVLVNTVNLTTNETGNKIITANNDTLALKLVEKLTINKTVIVGQNVTFTIVVNNTFNITLHNITITEIFNSTQLEYMNHTNSKVWIKEGNVFKYKGNLTAYQSLSFNITFNAKTNGTFVNTVNLTTNETGNSIDTANNTTVVYKPNMTVEKVSLNVTDFVIVNDTVAFNITVFNKGDCNLSKVNVTESFKANEFKFIRFVGADWSSVDNKTFVYGKNLTVGGNATFTIYFKALINGTLVNNVTARSNMTNDTNSSANVTVYNPNMTVEKVSLNITDFVIVNNTVAFNITVFNKGDCNLSKVNVTEAFNADEFEFIRFVGDDWTASKDNKTFFYGKELVVGGNATFTVYFKALTNGTLVNNVTARSNVTNDTNSSANVTVYNPNMTVEKVSLNITDFIIVNNTVAFNITVFNKGDCNLSKVNVTEAFNADEFEFIRLVGADWKSDDNKTFVYTKDLAVGANATFTVYFKALTNGTLVNNVTARSNVTNDTNSSANVTVYNPNMTVEKVSLNITDFVIVNNTVAFNITVFNKGDCTLGNVNVTEAFNADEFEFIRFVGADWKSEDNKTFVYTKDLAVGANATFTIYFKALTNGTLVNNVTARSNVTNDTNDTANVTVYNPNMTVEKVSLNITDFVIVNDTVAFNITVFNKGDCDLHNVTVTDVFDSDEFTFIRYSEDKGWTKSAEGYVFTYGNLAKGRNATFTVWFTAKVNGTLNNTAIAKSNETNETNSTANVTVYNPNMTVVKVSLNATDFVIVNDTVAFNITVFNTGDCDLHNVTVTDVFDSDEFTFVGYSEDKGWTKSESGYVFTYGDLVKGGNATFTVWFTVKVNGTLNNTAVAKSNETNETNSTDNVTVSNPGLGVVKVSLNATDFVIVNNTVAFNITVINKGSSDLHNVTVTESYIPKELTYINHSDKDLWIRSGDVFTYQQTLVKGGNATFTIWFIANTNGTLVNNVTAKSNETNETNDTADVTVYLPNMTVEKVSLNITDFVIVNNTVAFNITVFNKGDCTLGNVNVNEAFNADEFEFIRFVGADWKSEDNKTFVYTKDLAVGRNATFTVYFKALVNGTIVNNVTARSNVTNDTNSSANVTVYNPNMTIEKVSLNITDFVIVNNTVAFNITVFNKGDCTLGNVNVTEAFNADEFEFIKFVGADWKSEDNKTFVYTKNLAVGGNATFTVYFKALTNGTLVNNVTARSNVTNDTNDTANVTVYNPNMTVEKVSLNITDFVIVNNTVAFNITVFNKGDCTLGNVNVTEAFNADEFEFIRFVGADWKSEDNKTFVYTKDLAVGRNATFTIYFKALVNGTIVNNVTARSNVTNDTNSSANVTVYNPNMTVEKVSLNITDFVIVNNTVAFNITVFNKGDCTLGNVNVTEAFNADEFEFIRFVGADWKSEDNKTFVYTKDLAVGGNATFTVYFKALTNGTLVNNVTARSNVTNDTNDTANVTVYNPNMTVEKVSLNATDFIIVNDTVAFNITVFNTGDCDLHNVTVSDVFDSDEFTFIRYSEDKGWTKSAEGYVFTYGDLVKGGNATFTVWFTAKVNGTLNNTAIAKSNETNETNSTDNVTVVNPGLEVVKVSLNATDFVIVNNTVAFNITVINKGSTDLHNVTVTEKYPDGLTYKDHSDKDLWIRSGDVFTYQQTLVKGGNATFTIWFIANTNGTLVNNVTAKSNETNETNSTDNVTVYSPNMTVEKVSLNITDFVIVNGTVAFNITVTNTGDCVLGNVNVTEVFDDKEFKFIKFVGADWDSEDNKTFVYTKNLAVGRNATFTVYFKALTNGTLVNNVTARSNVTNDTNDTSNVTVYSPNMTVEKVSLNITDFVIVNGTVAFNITVTNTGDCVLGNVNVTEVFDDKEFKFIKFVGADWDSEDNKTFVYTKDLAVGRNATFTVYFMALTNGTLVNNVTARSNVTNDTNDTANVTVYSPNMTVQKISLNSTVTVYVNDTIAYNITVRNTGDCVLGNITVVEKYDASELEYVGYSGAGWSVGSDNRTFTYNGKLAVKGNLTFTVYFKALTNGTIVNNVTAKSNVTNETPGNNTTVVYKPNMTVQKISLNSTVTLYVNDTIAYNITVRNTGDCVLGDITVVEKYDASELEYVGYSGEGWSVGSDNRTFTYNGDLAVKGNLTFTVYFKALVNGTIVNNVTARSNVTNETPGNNTTVVYKPNMTVQKISLNSTVTVYVNDTIAFNITVTNTGDCVLGDITVVEKYDASELEYVGYSGEGWSVGSDNRTFTYDGDLKVKGNLTFTVYFKALTNGTIVNNVTAKSNVTNETPGNNTTDVKPICDVQISKLVNASSILVGESVEWTVTVVNVGPSVADDVVVRDTLPEGVKIISSHVDVGEFNEDTRIWEIGNLDVNKPVSLVLVTKIEIDGNITNVVHVSTTTNETNTTNNDANNTTVANPICDLEITKLVSSKKAFVGEELTWTIIVKNHGPSEAKDVKVKEDLPDSLEFIRAIASKGTFDKNTNIWTIGKLASGDTVTLEIVTKVLSVGNITNPVEVSTSTPDNNTTNNKANNTTVAYELVDLELIKSSDKKVYYVGDQMHWLITVINHGPSKACDVLVKDVLPSATKFISYTADKGSFDSSKGIWTIGELENGERVTLDILCKALKSGEFTNDATVNTTTNESDVSNNFDNATVTVKEVEPTPDPTPEPTPEPTPDNPQPTPEKPVPAKMHSTGNPIVYMIIAIFAILGCVWTRNRKE